MRLIQSWITTQMIPCFILSLREQGLRLATCRVEQLLACLTKAGLEINDAKTQVLTKLSGSRAKKVTQDVTEVRQGPSYGIWPDASWLLGLKHTMFHEDSTIELVWASTRGLPQACCRRISLTSGWYSRGASGSATKILASSVSGAKGRVPAEVAAIQSSRARHPPPTECFSLSNTEKHVTWQCGTQGPSGHCNIFLPDLCSCGSCCQPSHKLLPPLARGSLRLNGDIYRVAMGLIGPLPNCPAHTARYEFRAPEHPTYPKALGA